MTDPVMLDVETHLNVKINMGHGAKFGENIGFVPIIPAEFRPVAANYPIVLTKDPQSGQFVFSALLGLKTNENVFLDETGWDANYVPLHVQRQPFSIGLKTNPNNPQQQEQVVCINEQNPRVNEFEGEALFQEFGGQTPYLQKINGILSELMKGGQQTFQYTKILAENDLIEPLQLNVKLNNGESLKTEGLYTLNQEKVNQLSAEQLASFHSVGLLECVFLQLASLSQLTGLVARMNKKLDS